MSQSITYKNIKIHFSDEGQGKTIVLLHGFLENSSMWNTLKPELLQSHRIITVDLLGHGKTGCLGYIHTMSAMADGVFAVLMHLKIENYLLIGHSMGGYVALALAEKEPTAISGICLMNSTYEADDKERKALRRRASKMAHTNFKSLVQMSFTNLFSPKSRTIYKQEIGIALKEALKTPLQGYLAAQEGMMIRENKFDVLKRLKTKKIIIVGSKDPVVDGERILLETTSTDIVCKQISGGHMSHIENLSELPYLIKHFIELKYF